MWVAELNFQLRSNYPSIEEQANTAFELEWAAGEPISLLSSSMMNGPGGWVVGWLGWCLPIGIRLLFLLEIRGV